LIKNQRFCFFIILSHILAILEIKVEKGLTFGVGLIYYQSSFKLAERNPLGASTEFAGNSK